jgi:hypothetical protein
MQGEFIEPHVDVNELKSQSFSSTAGHHEKQKRIVAQKKIRSIQNLGRVEMNTSPAFSCRNVCVDKFAVRPLVLR